MCQKKINKFPNNKKEIYNDKYRHTRDRLFGLWFHQIHTKTDIYHTVTHLYISCSYYFNVKLIKRKYIMTNTDTLETDYSV
jgi:hypothetical protein